MSVRGLYDINFWKLDDDAYSDDWTQRNLTNEITAGTMSDKSSISKGLWDNCYKAIARANIILSNLNQATDNGISQKVVDRAKGEALFCRACQYGRLVFHFGDVPYIDKILTIEEANLVGREDKKSILSKIYKDLDDAAELLDVTYSGEERATKGAAYAAKARIALYMNDFKISSEAASKCMQLDVYELVPDWENMFLNSTKSCKEFVFSRPRTLNSGKDGTLECRDHTTRLANGFALKIPSWDLFFSFLCTDGKTVDQSPLFNPRLPFENRDPRCTMTIVEHGTPHLGFIYDPIADKVENLSTGLMVKNNDNRKNNQYGSYNALVWKKGIDMSWTQNNYRADKTEIIIRYADVLLMYAEAKIEQNEIDQSVLDAINSVRARAYGVDKSETSRYPSVTTTDQNELRKILRIERRMEFALENLRYRDIIRWRIAEKVLNTNIYGILDPAKLDEVILKNDLWFFPETPVIDENGSPILKPLEDKGYIKRLAVRSFDASRQYLWPIPYQDVQNSNGIITQNPNY